MRILMDKNTQDYLRKHITAQTTVVQCENCGLWYKPSLGHTCRRRRKQK